MPAAEPLFEALSERELEVLRLLNGPLSTPEIAGQLVVSANTVRTHIKNIYGKLGVHGRSGAVYRARELGLLGLTLSLLQWLSCLTRQVFLFTHCG